MILSAVFPPLLLPLPPLVLLPHALRMSTRMIPATIHNCLFLAFITLFSSPVLPDHLGDHIVSPNDPDDRAIFPFYGLSYIHWISYTDDQPAVGADKSALIHLNLSKSSLLSVGARAVGSGRVGLYGTLPGGQVNPVWGTGNPRAHSLSPLPA